jgi:hypothetical protein
MISLFHLTVMMINQIQAMTLAVMGSLDHARALLSGRGHEFTGLSVIHHRPVAVASAPWRRCGLVLTQQGAHTQVQHPRGLVHTATLLGPRNNHRSIAHP